MTVGANYNAGFSNLADPERERERERDREGVNIYS